MNSPGAVSDVVVGVAYDSAGFEEFHSVSKGRHHDDADSVHVLEPPSLVN